MSDDAPVVPDQWTVLDFDVDSEQLDVAFARQDRSAMVVLDRTRMQETAPEFLVDCRQFVVDPQDGVEAGTYVTAKVALARAIPEAVDYARQTPDLVIDVDVFPRHLDSVWAVEDDSFPYQSPPTDRFDAWYGSPDDVLGGSSQQ